MAVMFNVAGYSTLYVTGSDGTASQLGFVDENGIEMSFESFQEPIFTDVSGPFVPGDIQLFGSVATITCNLIKYDSAVLDRIRTGIFDGVVGSSPNRLSNEEIGALAFACSESFAFSIVNASTCDVTPEKDWYFENVLLDVGASRVITVGSRVTRQRLVLKCYPNSSGVMYTRVAP